MLKSYLVCTMRNKNMNHLINICTSKAQYYTFSHQLDNYRPTSLSLAISVSAKTVAVFMDLKWRYINSLYNKVLYLNIQLN
jgi:hypothetical protein